MSISNPYIFLFLAIIFGTASNSFAKSAEGFTLWLPSFASAITIILCMYALSNVMKVIPIGVTYASFAGLCIVATSVVGIMKFNQSPNLYTTVGLILIIVGVAMVNLLGKTGT
jgi:small multidrug resistance pump|tara:strand:- start:900 stop:1238 length:339 start_codon:yes stop_codon:yes gene_type:complete